MAGSGQLLLLTEKGIEDLTPFVRRFVYKNSLLRGHTRWRLYFDTSQWDFWKNFMIGNGLQFQVKVTGQKDGNISDTGWLSLVVDLSDGDLRGTYMKGRIEGGGIELNMMLQDKRRAFYQTTASSVVKQIAALYQLVPDIQTTSILDNWWQANQTDWNFLQELMSDYVPSQNNRGDAYLNIEKRKLTIKPINFAAPSVRQYDLTEDDDRVFRVRFRYYGGQVARRGIVVEARGFNRATGLPAFYLASPITAPNAALADKLPQAIASQKKVVVCGTGNLNTLRAVALREQAKHTPRYYGMAMRVLNDLTIQLRDMVEISAKDADGAGAFTEGRYAVYEYQLSYSPERIVTTVVGYRQESYAGPQPATGAPVSMSMGSDTYRAGAGNFSPTKVAAVPLGS